MPLLNKRNYQKKDSFRDATLFVIICEGEKREPQYFDFFDGLTSRIKVLAIPSEGGKSAPKHLIENADSAVQKYEIADDDELWFIVDTDRWEGQLHTLQVNCSEKVNWFIAISNPCFEVWLYYHFKRDFPTNDLNTCSDWKSLIPKIHSGGFDCNTHPSLIAIAIDNSRNNYSETGYIPNVGCTQIFRLAEKIYPLISKSLV